MIVASRHSIVRSPPGSEMRTLRSVRLSRAAATADGAGRRAAGLGQAGAALPGADHDMLARLDRGERDVGALGKDRMIFQHAARTFRDRRRSGSSTQNTACGLPMLTTDGECRIGLSIGPICNSIARVSRNSSASGISFQPKRGLPMSTVKMPGSPRFQQLIRPALVSKVERILAGFVEQRARRRSACRCRRRRLTSRHC